MDMYPKYKSKFGYQIGNNQIDSYGVDHSGFTTQDEVAYQFAREEKENKLLEQLKSRGITQDLPQYTTDFWGNPANNYGFGTTDIAANIEKMQNNTTPIPVATPTPQQQPSNDIQSVVSTSYPTIREDKRNLFNKAIETFVRKYKASQLNDSYLKQVVGSIGDLGENYINMINANYKSTQEMQKQKKTIDNYYHCVGNYKATQRGPLGKATALVIDVGREISDYTKNIYKGRSIQEANSDFINDMTVNFDGQKMVESNQYNSAFEACNKYRPVGYNPLNRLKYYKK